MTQETKIQETELSVFENNTFEGMSRIAETLANTSLIPDGFKGDGKVQYPSEKIAANCFLVVEQAHRWGMSPFSIMGCASVIHGKLMWEGKLIHAVIEKKLGVRLKYKFNDKTGDEFGVTVSGQFPGEAEPEEIEGTVGDWKTTGNNSPWTKLSQRKSMLRYRGAREWARANSPGVILGIVTQDEAQNFNTIKEATPIPTREQVAEKMKQALPEPDTATERGSLISKVDQAWDALGKTEKDFEVACKYYKVEDAEAFDDYPTGDLEKLLKALQKQMNAQAGKTQGQIEKERAVKESKTKELELEAVK